jgi:hypothetical protein
MELEPLKTDRQLKIYLDVCCLNRPFDDWTQERVRFEGESILTIVERMRAGQWQLFSSEAIAVELSKLRNLEKKENILKLLQLARVTIEIDESVDLRSRQLEGLGFGLHDSFHLACEETASVDIVLSTDDRLIKNAKRNQNILKVEVSNPVLWLMNFLQA